MRLVHLSDLHLGYRQYLRLTPTGINQREADVARTFQRAIDQVIALEPDIVVIAGDVFHTARPTNAAILHAFRQFLRLRNALPKAAIVLIGGDHDTPRTTETGSILALFEQLGLHVAAGEARRFPFPDKELSILAVPGVPGVMPSLLPDADARKNILLMHADVDDVVPRYQAEMDRAAVRVSRADLGASRWDYVALGHYHVHQQVDENAWYSGSIDYTSLDVWGDLAAVEELGRGAGKGFIEFDLERGTHQFHRVPPSREFVDLKAISARNLSVAEIDAAIRRAVEKCKGGIDDKVVRLIVRDIPRHVVRELDHRAIREYKHRALHFHLVPHRPEPLPRTGQGAPTRRPSVVDVVREQLRTRELPPDLDRERLVELGLKYLADAEAAPAAVAALEPESGS
ncbi:MAG TPA: DNA repair exonuclease [Gemmatimonadaceae bacterium]|nr:DNA repair exonuclease [Gemmatimonadaceae bacterium]